VTLETELLQALAARRQNLANHRREFFFATPEEVRDVHPRSSRGDACARSRPGSRAAAGSRTPPSHLVRSAAPIAAVGDARDRLVRQGTELVGMQDGVALICEGVA
jgi:hypothetical protein